VKASRNRVNRLCTALRIWSVHSRKRGSNRRPGPPVHDDRVLREKRAARRRPSPDILYLPVLLIPQDGDVSSAQILTRRSVDANCGQLTVLSHCSV
jgi:hypothetical protein